MKTQGRYALSNQSSVLTTVGLDRSTVFELNLPKKYYLIVACLYLTLKNVFLAGGGLPNNVPQVAQNLRGK